MRVFTALVFFVVLPLAGCMSDGSNGPNLIQSTVFAQPTVVYHTGDNLEVSYYNEGVQQPFNERNAIELLKKECRGAFRIAGRSNGPNGDSYIDAVCVH
jgi:hypothetical protein